MFYRDHMFRGTTRAAFIAVATVTLLAGCQGAELPPVSPTPVTTQSTATTRFSSKTEALTEAKRVYERYLVISDEISSDGGEGADRVAPYVTPEEFKQEQRGISYLKDKRVRVVGTTELMKFELESVNLRSGEINAYACVDISHARVRSSTGKDITPKSRQDRQTTVTRFVWQDDRLLLNENGVWSGDSIC